MGFITLSKNVTLLFELLNVYSILTFEGECTSLFIKYSSIIVCYIKINL